MEPVYGMDEPYHYRNKAQFPVGTDKEGNLVTGFYAGKSHQIIPCTDCAIQHPVNQEILEKVLHYMRKNHISAYDEKDREGTGTPYRDESRIYYRRGNGLPCT